MQTESTFESLFKRKADGDLSFLKDITEQYPYFAPAHFFLLKDSVPDSGDHDKQAAKTALLFNDPFWLNFQLHAKPETGIIEAKIDVSETAIQSQTVEPKIIPQKTAEVEIDEERQPEEEPLVPLPVLKFPAFDANKHNMLFEPMHMVDYFASQGIKLSEEVQTGDKLGKQLRSFTEWLKTTKRAVPATSAEMQLPGGQAENAIQSQAEKSNIEGEVLTESMAEVFAMQGKAKKAIEVYEKLSLLDPAKSAFFAAKINNLKG